MKKFLSGLPVQSIFYMAIGYLDIALNVVLNLLLLKFLTVGDYGKINIGRSIFQSFEFSHFGVRDAFDRWLPVTEDVAEKRSMFSTGLLFTSLSSSLFCLAWMLYDTEHILFNAFFFISGLIYSLVQIYRVYFRSMDDKKEFITITTFSTLLPTVTQIVCLLLFGKWGMLAGLVLSYAAVFILIAVFFRARVALSKGLAKQHIQRLVKTGFYVFLKSLVSFLAVTGDRLLIAKYWGFELVGQFSIIMFIFSLFALFPVNYTELIMNKLVKNMSLRYTLQHLGRLLALVTVFCIVAILAAPWAIGLVIPKYLYLYPQMKIIVLAILPASTRSLMNYYLLGIDKRKQLFLVEVASSFLYLCAIWAILQSSMDLNLLLWLKIGYFALNAGGLLYLTIYYGRKRRNFVN